MIAPGIFGAQRNPEKRAAVLAKELPDVMSYLEGEMPQNDFLCGSLSVADLALAPHFDNLLWARVELDWHRWPKTGAWLKRVHEESTLGTLSKTAVQLLRIPPPQHRDTLSELGYDVMPVTVGTETPRRGVMIA